MQDNSAARSRKHWDFFAGEAARQKAPLYAQLALAIRDDPELTALAAKARPGQPMANLIFAAVYFLLLRGTQHPLRTFYRTLLAGGDAPVPSGDPFPAFRDFCLDHRAEIAPLIASRVTNTNEVGRAAYLRAGYRVIANEAGGPLHLIELGPSAGLNLHWDRYAYRYWDGSTAHRAGPNDAPLVLDTRLDGAHIPPLGPHPSVGLRLGLERDPVDLSDPDARDWLKALVWPDRRDRFRRLEQALAATEGLALDIRAGDALDLLPDAIAGAPRTGALCVYHTLTTYQFSKPDREGLENMLIVAGLRRPIWRLSLEWSEGDYPLTLTRYQGGLKQTRILALCDPQGGSMEWRDEKSP